MPSQVVIFIIMLLKETYLYTTYWPPRLIAIAVAVAGGNMDQKFLLFVAVAVGPKF